MRSKPNLRILFLGCSIGSLLVAQACGGDDASNLDGSVDGSNDGSNDGTLDVTPQKDAASDSNQMDTSTNDTGTTDAASDATGTDGGGTGITSWKCGLTTVSDCSMCTGSPEPCVYCGVMDASVLEGVCNPKGTPCLGGGTTTFQDCRCTDASTCPESFQVCVKQGPNTTCQTCGDNGNTNGLKCENGGTCTSADGGC